MKRRVLWLPLVIGAALVPSLLAVPEPTAKELKENRVQLEQWRKHPEQLARLRHDLRTFLALPAERREQILKFDDALQHDKAAARLVNVLERYVAWLGQLPEADRREIVSQTNVDARIAIIQGLRNREWMHKQPRAVQVEWENKRSFKAKTDFVAKLRQEERDRQQEWRNATHFWKRLHDPRPPATRLDELDDDDREGVNDYLMPMLSAKEAKELHEAEGQWQVYLTTLVRSADSHPLALPSKSKTGPWQVSQLPQAMQKFLQQSDKHPANPKPLAKQLPVRKSDQWLEFARDVALVYQRQATPLPRELWAYNKQCLTPPMKDYVEHLSTLLTEPERQRLDKATNQWPNYPMEILKLAREHNLPSPPWATALSGPRERWDDLRTAGTSQVVAVPQQVLEDFAIRNLEPAKLAQMKKLPVSQFLKYMAAEYKKRHEAHGNSKMQHSEPREKTKGRRPFAFDHRDR